MPEAAAVLGGGAVAPERMNVLGVPVSALTMAQALLTLDAWIAAGEPHYVCVADVHGIMEGQRDDDFRAIQCGAGMVTPDGMPLVWLARWRGQRHVERVYGPDLMLATCERSVAAGYRHFFYGGAPGVVDLLVERLTSRFPGLQVAGTYAPPFRSLTQQEDDAVVQRINAAHPHIIWVGLGTPKQDRWMAEHNGRLGSAILIGVGAAFDFHAGVKRQAPRFIQRSGFEWLFRLACEPRRLWR